MVVEDRWDPSGQLQLGGIADPPQLVFPPRPAHGELTRTTDGTLWLVASPPGELVSVDYEHPLVEPQLPHT